MINDYIFDFVYGEALNDLYWRNGKNKGCKETVLTDSTIRDMVKIYANDVLGSKREINTYQTIRDISLNTNLTFGNAQKLLNMTMKYLYIICCVGEGKENYRKRFKFCHAPMDDIMRDIVGRAYKEKFGKYLGISGVSWSSVSEEDYKNYQNAIVALIKESGKDCLPIEFDYMNWGKKDPKEIEYEFFKVRD